MKLRLVAAAGAPVAAVAWVQFAHIVPPCLGCDPRDPSNMALQTLAGAYRHQG